MNYFYTNTGRIHITDPCYQGFREGLQGLINVLPGRWNASILERDNRVAELMIVHESSAVDFSSKDWCQVYNSIGVDSGQCGFFDFHGDDPPGGEHGSDDFYGRACRATEKSGWKMGVIDEGALSCSGYGDGGYPAFVVRDRTGQIIAAKLVFIEDDADYEEWSEDLSYPADYELFGVQDGLV